MSHGSLPQILKKGLPRAPPSPATKGVGHEGAPGTLAVYFHREAQLS